MALDYLKFVEAHEKQENYNIFEKVLMATQRAKSIYEEEKVLEGEDDSEIKRVRKRASHKPTYLAILEINAGKLDLAYSENKPTSSLEEVPATKEPAAETEIPASD